MSVTTAIDAIGLAEQLESLYAEVGRFIDRHIGSGPSAVLMAPDRDLEALVKAYQACERGVGVSLIKEIERLQDEDDFDRCDCTRCRG